MIKRAALVVGASLLMWGCGGDDSGGGAQSELADLLLEDSVGVVDEQCIRDKTDELSDEDAEFLVDNFDASDTEGFGGELEAWIEGLIDCFTLAESEG
jgi:hypothetical protein